MNKTEMLHNNTDNCHQIMVKHQNRVFTSMHTMVYNKRF